jgi:hypothetical protein
VTEEESKISKVQILHGSHGRKSGGHKRGSQCALPGEISDCAIKLALPRGDDDKVREVSRDHSKRAWCR